MSKELKALQEINAPIWVEYAENSANDKLCYRRYQVDIIETALKRLEKIDNSVKVDMEYYEKRNQALEIIKEKILDMDYFNVIADRCDLTYQEYELLKEVLK